MLSYHIHELYFVEFAGCFLVTRWLPCVDREKKPPGSPGATYLAEAVEKAYQISTKNTVFYKNLEKEMTGFFRPFDQFENEAVMKKRAR